MLAFVSRQKKKQECTNFGRGSDAVEHTHVFFSRRVSLGDWTARIWGAGANRGGLCKKKRPDFARPAESHGAGALMRVPDVRECLLAGLLVFELASPGMQEV